MCFMLLYFRLRVLDNPINLYFHLYQGQHITIHHKRHTVISVSLQPHSYPFDDLFEHCHFLVTVVVAVKLSFYDPAPTQAI